MSTDPSRYRGKHSNRGRLKRVKHYLKDEEEFCFTYGDGVGDIDITTSLSFHRHQGTLATVTAATPPRYLDQQKVGTRLLFAGNLTRQPYMAGRHYRVADTLYNADRIMNQTFWVGLWPGLEQAALDYIGQSLEDFCGR